MAENLTICRRASARMKMPSDSDSKGDSSEDANAGRRLTLQKGLLLTGFQAIEELFGSQYLGSQLDHEINGSLRGAGAQRLNDTGDGFSFSSPSPSTA